MRLNKDFHPPPADKIVDVKDARDGRQVFCRYFDGAWRDVDTLEPIEFIYWNRQP